jgi:hypothetical protein
MGGVVSDQSRSRLVMVLHRSKVARVRQDERSASIVFEAGRQPRARRSIRRVTDMERVTSRDGMEKGTARDNESGTGVN